MKACSNDVYKSLVHMLGRVRDYDVIHKGRRRLQSDREVVQLGVDRSSFVACWEPAWLPTRML